MKPRKLMTAATSRPSAPRIRNAKDAQRIAAIERQLWYAAERFPVLFDAFETIIPSAIKSWEDNEQARIKAAAKGCGLAVEMEAYRRG